MKLTTTFVLSAALLAGCSKSPAAYQAATAPVAEAAAEAAGVDALLAEADALFAQRVDSARLLEALAVYEKALAAAPTNRHALLHLTRGWYFHGDTQLTDKDAKIAVWEKAITYGKQCLALNPEFAQRVQNEAEKDAIAAATKADAPCIYWLASALGKWGRIQGIAKVLGQLPTVKAYISKVEELDPEYFHYGPARYWGAYYSSSSFTRDDEKSRAYFQASIDGAPYYLPTRGLRAEQFAVMTKDFALFAEDVRHILAADVTAHAELQPENTLEQKRAQALWDRRAELFEADAIAAWEQANPQ